MNCPGCFSLIHCKDGIVGGRQRYKCKDCNYRAKVPVTTMRLAFAMYLEGLGFRSTGRVLNISYGTVYQWIKKWGRNLELPKRQEAIKVVNAYVCR